MANEDSQPVASGLSWVDLVHRLLRCLLSASAINGGKFDGLPLLLSLPQVDTVLLDKTGTLTMNKPTLTDVVAQVRERTGSRDRLGRNRFANGSRVVMGGSDGLGSPGTCGREPRVEEAFVGSRMAVVLVGVLVPGGDGRGCAWFDEWAFPSASMLVDDGTRSNECLLSC